MNLCELPFATLSERNAGRDTLQFDIEEFDHELGQVVRRIGTVRGDPEYGLPTAKDEELYLALLKYTHDYNGCKSPVVHFSRSELLDLLGWKKTGPGYARLQLGLERLAGVRLSYERLWRDNRSKQWRDQGAFSILASYHLLDSRNVGASDAFTEVSSTFRWSSVLFDSMDSGYLKKLNYGLAMSFGVTGRRLYRYCDKHFHPPRKTKLVMDMARLGYQHIGISRNTELDKVRTVYLGPACEELEKAGVIASMPHEERFIRMRRGVWQVVVEQAKSDDSKRRADSKSLVEELVAREIKEQDAERFVDKHPDSVIRKAMRAMDEQRDRKNEIQNPKAWFEAATKGQFIPNTTPPSSGRLRPERKVFRAERIA